MSGPPCSEAARSEAGDTFRRLAADADELSALLEDLPVENSVLMHKLYVDVTGSEPDEYNTDSMYWVQDLLVYLAGGPSAPFDQWYVTTRNDPFGLSSKITIQRGREEYLYSRYHTWFQEHPGGTLETFAEILEQEFSTEYHAYLQIVPEGKLETFLVTPDVDNTWKQRWKKSGETLSEWLRQMPLPIEFPLYREISHILTRTRQIWEAYQRRTDCLDADCSDEQSVSDPSEVFRPVGNYLRSLALQLDHLQHNVNIFRLLCPKQFRESRAGEFCHLLLRYVAGNSVRTCLPIEKIFSSRSLFVHNLQSFIPEVMREEEEEERRSTHLDTNVSEQKAEWEAIGGIRWGFARRLAGLNRIIDRQLDEALLLCIPKLIQRKLC